MASSPHGSASNPICLDDEPPMKKVKIEPEFLYITIIPVSECDSMLNDDLKQCFKVPLKCVSPTKGFYMIRIDDKSQTNEENEFAKFCNRLLEENDDEDCHELKSDIVEFNGDVPLMEPHTTVIFIY